MSKRGNGTTVQVMTTLTPDVYAKYAQLRELDSETVDQFFTKLIEDEWTEARPEIERLIQRADKLLDLESRIPE